MNKAFYLIRFVFSVGILMAWGCSSQEKNTVKLEEPPVVDNAMTRYVGHLQQDVQSARSAANTANQTIANIQNQVQSNLE